MLARLALTLTLLTTGLCLALASGTYVHLLRWDL